MSETEKQRAIKKIRRIMINCNVELTDVVDMVIENNGIIGVGLISLANHLSDHCINEIRKQSK